MALIDRIRINANSSGILIAAGAGLAIALCHRLVLNSLSPHKVVAVARTRTEAAATKDDISPYPQDVFPGRRDVRTPYGTIRVYEWGPVDGEKVLLMPGIGTPCIGLGDMAREFVNNGGFRVMLFGERFPHLESWDFHDAVHSYVLRLTYSSFSDYFGRGYSDAPTDIPYDDRLYATQFLLVLASSSLSWTGNEAFHLVGYSLGGALTACFAAHFPHMLRSASLICPGGLIRPHHLSLKSKVIYSDRLLPAWLSHWLVRRRLEPQPGGQSADVAVDASDGDDVDFDRVRVAGSNATVGEIMGWQLRGNAVVEAYSSTISHAPIYNQHNGVWQLLRSVLEERRKAKEMRLSDAESVSGLPQGRVCLILATRDPVTVKDEWVEDSKAILGEDGVDIHIVPGGHEIVFTKGAEVASLIMKTWERSES